MMHYLLNPGSTGSLQEEYVAYMVGDVVRNELIQAGFGTGADIQRSLTAYTVDINNPNQIQLEADLEQWFRSQGLSIYVEPQPTGFGVQPFPLTFTPTSTPTP
jgi:hypothetical protein